MPVTWRNIGTVSGAGLIAAATKAGQGIGQGIANIGSAFGEYGDRKKQDETDLAVNALRAAAPEDREQLMQSYADSNISMHSDQIGKVAQEIDEAEATETFRASKLAGSAETRALANRQETRLATSAEDKLLTSALDRQVKQGTLDKQKAATRFLGDSTGTSFGSYQDRMNEASLVLDSNQFKIYQKKEMAGLAKQSISEFDPKTTKGSKARGKWIDNQVQTQAPNMSGASLNMFREELRSKIGQVARTRTERESETVYEVSDSVRDYISDSGEEITINKLANQIETMSEDTGARKNKVIEENLPEIRSVVANQLAGTFDETRTGVQQLARSISDPDVNMDDKWKLASASVDKAMDMYNVVNNISTKFNLDQSQEKAVLEGIVTREGLKEIMITASDAEETLVKQRIAEAKTLQEKVEAGTKMLGDLRDKYTPSNTLAKFKKQSDNEFDGGDEKTFKRLLARAKKKGIPEELFLKAFEENVYFYDEIGSDGFKSVGKGLTGDKVYREIATAASKLEERYEYSYPKKKQPTVKEKPVVDPIVTTKQLTEVEQAYEEIRAENPRASREEIKTKLERNKVVREFIADATSPYITAGKSAAGIVGGAATAVSDATNVLINSLTSGADTPEQKAWSKEIIDSEKKREARANALRESLMSIFKQE